LGFAAFELAMRDFLQSGWNGLFASSLVGELRRTERRIAGGVRRAARNCPFQSWACMPELEVPQGRLRVAPRAAALLARLADPARPAVPAPHISVVVAQPGDETLTCGATLSRLKGVRLIVVGNGLTGPGARNFASRAGSHWRELETALALAGLKTAAVIGFGLNEGEASEAETALAGRFARQFFRDGTAVVLTRAGEGEVGDAVLRALETAIALCRVRGQEIAVIDMAPTGGAEGQLVLELDAWEQALKRRMLACFSAPKLRKQFLAARESFRLLPRGEVFSRPHGPAIAPESGTLVPAELRATA
jgi:hypothetical protein